MNYPEHEKLTKVSKKSQIIGEFIEWLRNGSKFVIAEWQWDADDDAQELERTNKSIEQILAQYFDIDQNKLETEKLLMLHEMRNEGTKILQLSAKKLKEGSLYCIRRKDNKDLWFLGRFLNVSTEQVGTVMVTLYQFEPFADNCPEPINGKFFDYDYEGVLWNKCDCKRVPKKDLPLYLSGKTVHPELEKTLKNGQR